MPPMPARTMELAVPLSALAQPDDAERLNTPAAGDSVTLTVEAKVTRIEGEQAFIQAQTVNGQALETEPEATEPDGDEAEASELRAMALNA